MATINIAINNRIASVPAGLELVCNNPTDSIQFVFDEEWKDINEKTARFSWEGQYIDVSFFGDTVQTPEIYKTDYVYVGVYGIEITSTPVKLRCKRSILCYGDTVRAPLTDPFYEEFCDRINAAEEKVSEMQEVIDSTYTYLEDGGSPLNIPGNAGTATKLHTPVKIGEADFDGSEGVTLEDMGAAKDDHVHGNITTDGKIGTTAGCIVTTATDGEIVASHAEEARNKLGLAAIAATGSYNDLKDIPKAAPIDSVISEGGKDAVNSIAVIQYVEEYVEEHTPAVDSSVTNNGANAVSGAAVAAYVAQQLAAITDYEGVEF